MRTESDLILGGDAGGPEGVAADPLGPARRGGPAFHHVEGVVTPAMPDEASACLGRGAGDGPCPAGCGQQAAGRGRGRPRPWAGPDGVVAVGWSARGGWTARGVPGPGWGS